MAFITLSVPELSNTAFFHFPEIIKQACLYPGDGDYTRFHFINTALNTCSFMTLKKIISGFEGTPVTHVCLTGTSFEKLDAFELRSALQAFRDTNVISLDLVYSLPLYHLSVLKGLEGLLPNIKSVHVEDFRHLPLVNQLALRAIFPNARLILAAQSMGSSPVEISGPVLGIPMHVGAPRAYFGGSRPPFASPVPIPVMHFGAPRPRFGIPLPPPGMHFGMPSPFPPRPAGHPFEGRPFGARLRGPFG